MRILILVCLFRICLLSRVNICLLYRGVLCVRDLDCARFDEDFVVS